MNVIEQNVSHLELPVRYSETDAMGIVYYANYLIYFEVARTTALADLGHPYHILEKNGLRIPVLDVQCTYKKPARYGDKLNITTVRWRLGRGCIRFCYEIKREEELVTLGQTDHAFVNLQGKPVRPPKNMIPLFPDWKET